MDKVTKQRDPKRQAAGRKGHEKHMAKLKEDILKNVGNDSSSSNSTNGGIDTTNYSTNDGTNTTSTTTNDSTDDGTNTTSTTTGIGNTNFSYIHGVGAIAVLALGVFIFIIPKYLKKTVA